MLKRHNRTARDTSFVSRVAYPHQCAYHVAFLASNTHATVLPKEKKKIYTCNWCHFQWLERWHFMTPILDFEVSLVPFMSSSTPSMFNIRAHPRWWLPLDIGFQVNLRPSLLGLRGLYKLNFSFFFSQAQYELGWPLGLNQDFAQTICNLLG